MKRKNLYEYFKEIPDFRRAEGRMHELPVILIIALMAIMSWYWWERAMWDFVKKNAEELRKYIKPKKGYLPSYQTIDLVLTKLWYDKIERKFLEWMKKELPVKEYEQICLDGKAISWTIKNQSTSRQDLINVISAFHEKDKQVIWMRSERTKKEWEITSVKKLLKKLKLEGVVFTADALHCQKDTVKEIKKSNNHYVIWVKNNQKKLLNWIKKKDHKKSESCDKSREKKQR